MSKQTSSGEGSRYYGYSSVDHRARTDVEEGELRRNKCCHCTCRNTRYAAAIMCCLGLLITFGFRCNIGVATGYFRLMRYNATLHDIGAVSDKHGINWSAQVIGAVESSYFWGYLIFQIPGGIIANRFSASRVFSIVTLCSSVLNLLLPVALRASYQLAIVIRVVQGMLEGCMFPSCQGILSHWAPSPERSRLASIAYSGGYIGAFLGLLLSGVMTQRIGWTMPFYVYGSVGVIWFCVWLTSVFEHPSEHPCITDEELEYIEADIGKNFNVNDMIRSTPWRKFLTSMPLYAILVANVARNWSIHLFITEPTKYFDDVFKYSFSWGGFYSALPHLAMAIVTPIGGYLADELRKGRLSTTGTRILLNSLGFCLHGVLLFGVTYSNDSVIAVVCLVGSVGLSGLSMSGFMVNLLDIAPRYASLLMGIINGIGSLSSVAVPILTMSLVRDHSQKSWSKVFLITALISFASAIFYAIFASGEKQNWAESPSIAHEKLLDTNSPSSTRERRHSEPSEEWLLHSGGAPLFQTAPSFVQEKR